MIKVEVGKKYIDREGKIVEIKYEQASKGLDRYPFVGENDRTYTKNGEYLTEVEHDYDLIELVEEVEPQAGARGVPNTLPDVKHYKGGEVQPIHLINSQNLNFNLGCIVKYAVRSPYKGSQLEDLQKIKDYVNFEIERINGKKN